MINPWDLLPKWAKLATVGLVLIGSTLLIMSKLSDIRADGEKQGAGQERTKNIDATLERVEISHEATEEIRKEATTGNGSLLYAQCLRSARTPTNCKRFLPQR